MPWVWWPARKNLDLPVLKEDPHDEAHYYHCPVCQGWIKGHPVVEHIDTITILAGRRGETETCIRCGEEIGFTGEVS